MVRMTRAAQAEKNPATLVTLQCDACGKDLLIMTEEEYSIRMEREAEKPENYRGSFCYPECYPALHPK